VQRRIVRTRRRSHPAWFRYFASLRERSSAATLAEICALKNAAAMRFTACRHLLGPLALAACGTSTATTPDAGTTSRRDASYSADANTDARTALPDARRVDAPPVDAHPSLVDGGFSVILSAEGGTPISPLLYGVNYDWNLVHAATSPAGFVVHEDGR
jgi:hypothetical protein